MYEKEILDSLPSATNQDIEYCRFFDKTEFKCTVYQSRPFACRIFLNFENDSKFCLEACRDVKSLKNAVFMFLEQFLGRYVGPYSST